MPTKNIIIFGRTGAGKSSVVNLMAGEERAKTSNGMQRCTECWTKHSITLQDGRYSYNMFDTIGLEDHQGIDGYLGAIEDARNLIAALRNEGGLHLLLFCVRAGRLTSTTENNYRLFYEYLCEKKVPVVLVITGLEEEQNIDAWWDRAKPNFDKHGIIVDGHACITAVSGSDQRHQQFYDKSHRLVCNLVTRHCMVDEYKGGDGTKKGEGWFSKLMRKLKQCFWALKP